MGVERRRQLLILRCTTFVGVCVEFVAAVAWLAELFPNPKQREAVLGYYAGVLFARRLMVGAALTTSRSRGALLPGGSWRP